MIKVASMESSSDVAEAMMKDQVVPDVTDKAPRLLLEVKYGNKIVNLGTELTMEENKPKPEINWPADPEKFYLLFMLDPDAPSRGSGWLRSIVHWLVVNIPGNKLSEGLEMANYRSSHPPPLAGFHRYVFLLYEQPSKLDFAEESFGTLRSRMKFKVTEFAKKHNLGTPIAGNYYQCKSSSSCSIV